MKKINYTKTIGFALILGFVALGTSGFSQSSNFLDFDGTNDYVRYNNDATLQLMNGATNYTIEAWIYPVNGLVAEFDRVLQRYYSFNIQMWDGDNNGFVEDWYLVVVDGSNGNHFFNTEGDATLTLDAWNHIAVINNSVAGTLKLYVNGIDVTAAGGYANYSMRSAQTGDNLYIGQRGNTTSFFGGYIDEVRIKKVAEDIGNLQNQITDDEYTTDANTAGLFHLDEGTGTTTVNSASSTDATLYNDVLWRSWDFVSGQSLPLNNRYVWNGSTDSDWGTTLNWDPGITPSPTDNVIIKDVTNDPQIAVGTSANCNDLEIASNCILSVSGDLTVNGTLTNNGGNTGLVIASGGSLIESTPNVAATVDRDYTGGEWHLISSPISGATANMFLGLYLQNHTESTNAYIDVIPQTTPLNVMQGYALWNAVNGTADFVGTLNTGAIGSANNVTRSGQGWNLVGNPYPSPIDWDAVTGWTKTNVDNATYRHVDNATWASYVGGVGANGGTRFIASCQGFFVGVNSGYTLGTLNMTNAVRTHSTSTFFKDEVTDIVRLEVSGNGYTDETVIRFLDEATAEFDGEWDAHKLFGTVADAPAIYSSENAMMAINSLPAVKLVPIGVNAGVAGEFTITATETSEFANVILEDLQKVEFIDLKTGSYTFNYDMEFDNRFILHFTPMAVGEELADLINIYSTQKDVFVNVPANTSGEIVIYNIMGQEIIRSGINSTVNKVTLNESAYYIVKVISNEGVVTKKVFVK